MTRPVCLDCAALPRYLDAVAALSDRRPGALRPGVDYQPTTPRPIHAGSGPRSPRCATHRRQWLAAQRQAASDARSRRRSGLDEERRRELLALQGGRCPCGARPAARRNLDADHDHQLAAQHDHPDDVACEACLRGYLCRRCNRELIGRYRVEQLASVVAYLTDPPMARLLRARAAASEAPTSEVSL